jgi:hypothetical protein
VSLATAVTLRASAAASASGSGDAVDLSEARTVDLILDVTAISGTLTVIVQTASTETGPWTEVSPVDEAAAAAKFTAATTISSQRVTFPDCRQFVRVSWTLSALGTATFAVTGESFVVYAGPADLARLGLRGSWAEATSSAALDALFRQATDETDSALVVYWLPELPTAELTGRLPLISWGDDIRGACCAMVAASALTVHGVRPDENDNATVFDRAELARAWLDLVAAGRRKPARMVERPTA